MPPCDSEHFTAPLCRLTLACVSRFLLSLSPRCPRPFRPSHLSQLREFCNSSRIRPASSTSILHFTLSWTAPLPNSPSTQTFALTTRRRWIPSPVDSIYYFWFSSLSSTNSYPGVCHVLEYMLVAYNLIPVPILEQVVVDWFVIYQDILYDF